MNILFIHIPKTGGSTIERVFKSSGYQVMYLDGKMGKNSVNHLRRCTPQHMHAAMLEQNFRLKNFDLVFMLVRDPLSRFKSEYIWRNRKKFTGVKPSSVQRWGEKSLDSYTRDSFIYDNHLRPQSEFYTEGADVYRFEEGLDNVLSRLGSSRQLSLNTDIPRLKEAKAHTGYSSSDVSVTPKLEKRIKDFYHKDYEMFGYLM